MNLANFNESGELGGRASIDVCVYINRTAGEAFPFLRQFCLKDNNKV